jgi:hypothetical protein
MVYAKLVVLNTIYNFVFDFFHLKLFRFQNMYLKSLDFEFQNFKF